MADELKTKLSKSNKKMSSLEKGFRHTEVPRLDTEESIVMTTIENLRTSSNIVQQDNKHLSTEPYIHNTTHKSLEKPLKPIYLSNERNIVQKIENVKLLNSLKASRHDHNFSTLNVNDLNAICKQEDKKIKTIIFNQTNNNFLKSNRLPILEKHVSNSIQNLQIHNKLMGEHYNPFNYSLDQLRSKIKRNITGAPFQH